MRNLWCVSGVAIADAEVPLGDFGVCGLVYGETGSRKNGRPVVTGFGTSTFPFCVPMVVREL